MTGRGHPAFKGVKVTDQYMSIPVSEFEALHARLRESEAENDRWQKKLTVDAWPEIERLRALIDKHNDECRECPVIESWWS
jgi:hypothetical protein